MNTSNGKGVDFQVEGPVYTRAFVLHPDLWDRTGSASKREPQARLAEAIGLAAAIDLEIAGSEIVGLSSVTPSTYFGSGKVKQLSARIAETDTEVAVVNAQLTPGQQRNLERAWNVKVLDRTGLILEIFGERATTKEGRLQVELAHLDYQKSRLVRSWTHLERQRGGRGFMGGPGERQIEADKRQIQERMTQIRKSLDQVKRTRALHRTSRQKVPYPVVALVGYTNAGKSTLFNRLTGANVYAQDLLFATLDPTMRQVDLPSGRRIIVSDTVGFVSDLPTMLVAAFRATLEEVLQADLLVHVRDISSPETQAQARDVHEVLKELGVGEDRLATMIEVWNKIDLVDADDRDVLLAEAQRKSNVQLVSALKGKGMQQLLAAVELRLAEHCATYQVELAAGEGEDLAWVYQHAEVLCRRDHTDGGVTLDARFDARHEGLAKRRLGSRLSLHE